MTGSFSLLTRQTPPPTVKCSPRCAGTPPNSFIPRQPFIKHPQLHISESGDSSSLLSMVPVSPKTPGRTRFPGPRPTSLPSPADTTSTTRTLIRDRSHISATFPVPALAAFVRWPLRRAGCMQHWGPLQAACRCGMRPLSAVCDRGRIPTG